MKTNLNSFINKFSKIRILVVGDVILDQFIWGKVRRISPEAPVPVVDVKNQTYVLGGAANVVNNIRALGGHASLAGVVGSDHSGNMVIDILKQVGADPEGIIRKKSRPTSVKTRIIAHKQQVVRYDHESRNYISDKSVSRIIDFASKKIKSCHAVLLSDYAKGVITGELTRAIIEMASKKSKPVLVDPKVPHMDFFRNSTIITPNHLEAGEAVGMELDNDQKIKTAGKKLIEWINAEAILITRGEGGMSLIERGINKPFHVPAHARDVYDVMGAGDTVIASLAMAHAAGANLRDATTLSNIAAGIQVGKFGTATVSTRELKEAIKKLK